MSAAINETQAMAHDGEAPKSGPRRARGRRNGLEAAVGREVRALRRGLDLTVADLAAAAGLSIGMLSKIENGLTSPSLNTLKSLSATLSVPVGALFRSYESQRPATLVRHGEGQVVERRGTRMGHEYRLLGRQRGSNLVVEPHLVTLTDESVAFAGFHHAGAEFIHVLSGRMTYQHGDLEFEMAAGDSLIFDAAAPHGPLALHETPVRLISVCAHARFAEPDPERA